MNNLAELERKDYEALLELNDQFSGKPLRTSAVQKAFGWGYNRTLRTVQKAVEQGVLQEAFDRGFCCHYTFTDSEDIAVKKALKITGFSLCDFKGDGQDECYQCNKLLKVGVNIYYDRTCYESDEGEYYCEQCLIETPERLQKEANDWANYAQDNNLI